MNAEEAEESEVRGFRMTHVSNREIASMSAEALADRLEELQEELLQLRANNHLVYTIKHGCIQGNTPLDCTYQDQNGIPVIHIKLE